MVEAMAAARGAGITGAGGTAAGGGKGGRGGRGGGNGRRDEGGVVGIIFGIWEGVRK